MTEKKRKIAFIVNPISGTGNKERIPSLIEQTLDKNLFDYSILFTESAGHAAKMATDFASQGYDICAAVGGDGTVNEVARSLVDTETALAILPCGSGNGLARHLCLPLDLKEDIAIINKAHIERFDYGIINGLPFFCTCGMGFDAFISLKFAEAGKRGPITYVENVLKEGLNYKPETYTVEDESGTHHYKAFLIACANAAQYGNNAYIAPGASMKDGLMNVIIMEPFDVIDAPKIAMDLFAKTLSSNSRIKTFQARNIHVHRSSPGAIHFDGDPIMTDADVDVSMKHLGIKIVINPDITEDEAQPNPILNAFSDLFNNINNVRDDIVRGGHRIQALNKLMLRKLSKL